MSSSHQQQRKRALPMWVTLFSVVALALMGCPLANARSKSVEHSNAHSDSNLRSHSVLQASIDGKHAARSRAPKAKWLLPKLPPALKKREKQCEICPIVTQVRDCNLVNGTTMRCSRKFRHIFFPLPKQQPGASATSVQNTFQIECRSNGNTPSDSKCQSMLLQIIFKCTKLQMHQIPANPQSTTYFTTKFQIHKKKKNEL